MKLRPTLAPRAPRRLSVSMAGLVAGLMPFLAHAGAARPGPMILTQPDGKSFVALQKGDEWCNRIETRSGHTIEQDARGTWRYVTDVSSGRSPASLGPVVVEGLTPAQLPPHLAAACTGPAHNVTVDPLVQDRWDAFASRYSAATPFKGTVLFILTQFNDQKGFYSEADFSRFVQEDIGGFYRDVSYGAADLAPAKESFGTVDNGVVGWVTLNYNHPNTGSSTGVANQKLSKDAILAADPYVNYAAYDYNHDGYVDANELAVVVIVAGYERSYARVSPSIWAHQWYLDPVGSPTVDGVIVGDSHNNTGGYAQFGEIHKAVVRDTGHQATVGVMVHELGHLVFRLPDLYDTDSSSNGAGAWCYMSYGSWGQASDDPYSGQHPVNPGAWVREAMGWSLPASGSGNFSVSSVGDTTNSATNTLVRLNTTSSTEHFLIENRALVGYDRGLYGLFDGDAGGLAIWHVDDSVNNNRQDRRRLADVEEADGDSSAYKPTNLWYLGNGTVFGNSSVPSSALNGGKNSGVEANSFSAPGRVMTFTGKSAP